MVNDIMQIIKEADSHADIGMLKDIEAFLLETKKFFLTRLQWILKKK